MDDSSKTTKLQNSSQLEPSVLLKESFPDGILKTTYSSGVVMYKIPKNLMLSSILSPTLNCGTPPSNSFGCCCLTFVGYQVVSVPNQGTVAGLFFTDEKIYTFFDGSIHRMHIKVTATGEYSNGVLFDALLNNEPPSLATCTDSYNILIAFDQNLTQCEGPIRVEAEKVYRLAGTTNFNTCVATQGNSYYFPHNPPPFNCAF